MVPTFDADLLARYRALGLSPPPWAYPLPPSIPFIGKNYGSWGGFLVYASAENLSHYERHPHTLPAFLHDHRALDRHRAALDNGEGDFFPVVHMAPSRMAACSWPPAITSGGCMGKDPRT